MLDGGRRDEGLHAGQPVVLAAVVERVPCCQQAKSACSAWTYSRMRGAGALQGIPYFSTMFVRMSGPRPRWNRPPESAWRFQAATPTTIGERAKATTALVATRISRVATIAAWAARNPSVITSGTMTPSKPERLGAARPLADPREGLCEVDRRPDLEHACLLSVPTTNKGFRRATRSARRSAESPRSSPNTRSLSWPTAGPGRTSGRVRLHFT